MTTSPENNIAKIFARNPTEHTDNDIKAIIATLREKRALFKAGGTTAPRAGKQPAKKINLDELEL